ncbi:MAG: hypothetical protein ACREUE_16980 [Panacagrimonas sp.]
MDRPAPLILRGVVLALDLTGKAWNLPNTGIGLFIGGIALLRGGHVGVAHNAIEVRECPLMNWLAPHGAITLGNVILYGRHAYALAAHERVHTLQGQFTGPAYLPLNLLGMFLSLISWPIKRLRRPHCGPFHGRLNFMEGWPDEPQLYRGRGNA